MIHTHRICSTLPHVVAAIAGATTMTELVTVRFATVEKITIREGRWTKVRGIAALVIDSRHGYTRRTFESLGELGKYLEAKGFEWIANSRGEYRREPERIAA